MYLLNVVMQLDAKEDSVAKIEDRNLYPTSQLEISNTAMVKWFENMSWDFRFSGGFIPYFYAFWNFK